MLLGNSNEKTTSQNTSDLDFTKPNARAPAPVHTHLAQTRKLRKNVLNSFCSIDLMIINISIQATRRCKDRMI